MSKLKLFLSLATLLGVPAFVQAADAALDASHTRVGFTVGHMVISTVTGNFDKFSGNAKFDEKTAKLSEAVFTIETASINTNDAKRDEHLRSPDFFDAEKFPTIVFKTDKPATLKKGKAVKVPGTLTIRGVTKAVNLEFTYKGSIKDPWGNNRHGFEAKARVKRADFGLTWNMALEAGGVAVGEEVDILITGEATSK